VSVETLDLDLRISAEGVWTRTGGTGLVNVLTDDSDATYARSTIKNKMCKFSCVDPGAVTGKLVSVCPWVRAKKDGTMRCQAFVLGYYVAMRSGRQGPGRYVSTGVALKIPHADSPGDFEIAAHNGLHDFTLLGTHWERSAKYAGLGLIDTSSSSGRATVYEAGLKAYYLEPATLDSPSAPSGTVTATQMPDCSVDVACIVESWQVPSDLPPWLCDGSVEFRVYADADVPPGSTSPPALAQPVWQVVQRFTEATYGDGSTPTEQTVTATPEEPLTNGDYWLFARVSRDLPEGADLYWSGWTHAEFTMDIDLPNTPTLSVTADDDEQRVDLSLTVVTTATYEDDSYLASIERSDDGGLTWKKVRGCQDVVVAIGANDMGADYEAPRGVTVTYRARVSAELTADSTQLWSEWDTDDVETYAVQSWNLKAPEDPTKNWIAAPVRVEPQVERDQEVAVFHPFDRLGAVVLGAPVSGETGTLEVYCHNAADVALFKAIVAWEGALYLETPWGEARYIHVTRAGWVLGGLAGAPWRTASLEYVEVGMPAIS
jgi:hypothetical protein